MSQDFDNSGKFTAFISYSHADQKAANKLLNRLQTYRLPKDDQHTEDRRLGDFFIDREELAASGSLSESILEGIRQSRCMIVLCSKAAASSEWVNKEINAFRACHPEAVILPVILNEPNAESERPTSLFPEALSISDDEPLAADMRSSGDGSYLGFLKLVSALADVPLNQLLQKDTKRRNRRVTAVTLASALLATVMLSLALFANAARQEAEERRDDVEGMVDFMLTDLKSQLEPVGRLDVLDGVAVEVIDYYDRLDVSELDCDAAIRNAHAFHLATMIHNNRNDLEGASFVANRAIDLIDLKRPDCADDPDFMIADGHSEYWAASPIWQSAVNLRSNEEALSEEVIGLLNSLRPYYERYEAAITPLARFPERRSTYLHEQSDLATNFASLHYYLGEFDVAALYLDEAIETLSELLLPNGELRFEASQLRNHKSKFDTLANLYGWKAGILENSDVFEEAFNLRRRENEIMLALSSVDPKSIDYPSYFKALQAEFVMLRIRAKSPGGRVTLAEFIDLDARFEKLIGTDPTNKVWNRRLNEFRSERAKLEAEGLIELAPQKNLVE
ncbi:MAG: TIR domain-containing protein [Pseudomonadota bacterium]